MLKKRKLLVHLCIEGENNMNRVLLHELSALILPRSSKMVSKIRKNFEANKQVEIGFVGQVSEFAERYGSIESGIVRKDELLEDIEFV